MTDAPSPFSQRTLLLLGSEAVEQLAAAHVVVVGIGGVGAYAVEMLVRAGVGHLTLIDGDVVGETNLNRQLPALLSTVGEPKVEVMRARVADINPLCRVDARRLFITPDNIAGAIGSEPIDFLIDAIDAIAPKVALIAHCRRQHIKMMSSMGAGGRVDPTKIRYADIADTRHDGLAREVRRRLRHMGILSGVKTVFSDEQPRESAVVMTNEIDFKRSSYGTVAWIPAIFGMMLAAAAVKKLTAPRND